MKLVSFNINSIRARLHQLQMVAEKYRPEVIGLQETKVVDADFPAEMVRSLGYEPHFHGQKTHYGVALLTRTMPQSLQKGYPSDEQKSQRRFIAATLPLASGQSLTVLNGYFPQGESREHPQKFPAKRQFYADLMHYLNTHHSPNDMLALMGDFNIAPEDIDVGIGEDNAKRWLRTGKCSFLPEEREWMAGLLAWGFFDSYRLKYATEDGLFSWFDYRSRAFEGDPKRGLRIDFILLTQPLVTRCLDAGIDYEIRAMEKPSDHCPVWVQLDL